MGVVLFHYGKDFYPFNDGVLNTFIVNSSFRVSFFFFISGFVMALVYGPQFRTITAKEFYLKRATRIMPMYWIAFFLSMALIFFVLHASPKGPVIVLHFLGLQTLDPGYVLDLNFTAWTISVELVFYAVFPFLLKWLFAMRIHRTLALAAIIWLLQSAQHIIFVGFLYNGTKRSEEFISTFPLWHLPTFIGGMAAARVVLEDILPSALRRTGGWIFVASLAVIGWIILVPNMILKYIHNGLLVPVFATAVLGLFYDPGVIRKIMSWKPLVKLGDLSFAIFMFQYPLWIACTSIAGDPISHRSGFFLLYVVALLLFSWLVNTRIEKPLLLYLRRSRAEANPR